MFTRFASNCRYDKFPFVIQLIQISRQAISFENVSCCEKIKRIPRLSHARSGIDARRECKSHIIFSKSGLIESSISKKFCKSHSWRASQDFQTIKRNNSVLTSQGYHVGECREPGHIE